LTREAAASLEAAGSLEAAALALGAETGDSATKAPLPEAMVAPAPSDTGVQAAAPNAADGLRAGSDEEVLTSPAAAVHDGTGIEDILLVLGVVLAAAGALLLLVVWLARRTVDPLLR
jgi:hypothetical protein